jgi:hypothetical protein
VHAPNNTSLNKIKDSNKLLAKEEVNKRTIEHESLKKCLQLSENILPKKTKTFLDTKAETKNDLICARVNLQESKITSLLDDTEEESKFESESHIQFNPQNENNESKEKASSNQDASELYQTTTVICKNYHKNETRLNGLKNVRKITRSRINLKSQKLLTLKCKTTHCVKNLR